VNGHEWDAMGYREVLGEPYAPYGCYPCRGEDNWIIVACASDLEWLRIVSLIGESSWATDPRFATKSGRQEHHAEIDLKLSEWTRRYTPRQAFRLLQEAGVAAGIPCSGEDLYYDLHLRERGHIVETETRPWGKITHHGLPGIPFLSAANAARPAPWMGANNHRVFGEILGLSNEEIDELKKAEAIK
jgi:crotonobetainyl-CoA:carnitine CoA-transferase CaiB-like acyl-CoA transferase